MAEGKVFVNLILIQPNSERQTIIFNIIISIRRENIKKANAVTKRRFSVLIPELVPPSGITMDILSPLAEVVVGFDRPYTEEEFVERIRNADAVIITSREKATRRVIEAAEKLKVISKHGVGIDNIDIEAATRRG